MSVQQFCLRWNNHQPNFISVCSSLLHNGTLVDVTLAAEGKHLQAHKIVLSACSAYFQTLFTTNPCQHPIVILKDVQYNDLKTMVDFMYYGEVNVSQEQLPQILKTAEMLKIKGLAEMPDAAASLTKSESKSSSDQSEQLQGAAGGGGNGGGSDSIWGSTESQQFQTHHHHHQTQQTQSQQQQQHHHHHHHQQQQQQQQQHQHHHSHQRRSPSPSGAGASPATRRKRLRKSSTGVLLLQGSSERTSGEEQHQHGSIDGGGSTNINLSQMNQMSFGGAGGGGVGSSSGTNIAQTIHTKIIKESSSTEADIHPHDSSQESIDEATAEHHHVQQIKPEIDISSVQQSLPIDISGPGTPSDHDTPGGSCTQSQPSHTGVQWTVVDSNYPRFSLPACQGSLSIGDSNNHAPGGDTDLSTNNSTGTGNNQQQHNGGAASGNSVVTTTTQQQQQQQQGHIQMQYPGSTYTPQIISVNNLASNYSQNLSTPTSPNESAMVQSVYSQGPTPTQSPVHATLGTTHQQQGVGGGGAGPTNTNSHSSGATGTGQEPVTPGGGNGNVPSNENVTGGGSGGGGNSSGSSSSQKRKRSVNPQGDENFLRALEAVRTGGIGFCKAARLYGVNNRTLWLEYKKRGYPISRPSIKNRIKLEPNISPPPSSTPTNEETTIENYDNINQPGINMQVPPTSETPASIMCTPHGHPMGVMSFLDTRHMEFSSGIHTMSRQRYTTEGTVNVNTTAMNLQGLNFNSM